MKMTSKLILSFVAAGLLLSSVTSQGLAQTEPSPKPMSKKALKTLCKKTPTDSRCPASTKEPGAASLGGSSSTPPATGGGSDPMKPAGDTMSPPPSSTGGGSDPMKPAGDTMSPPATGTPTAPSGGTSKP
jgi:hypothetical protein